MISKRILANVSVQTRLHSSHSVDPNEVKRFGQLSEKWFDEQGPFKPLHALNKLRVPWILNNTNKNKSPAAILDVGCGGGLLSIPLSRAGLHVTGIDATPEAISSAREWVKSPALKRNMRSSTIHYETQTVEDFALQKPGAFDVVVASEIVEHVADLNSFVSACVALTKPGGKLFFTTINKTLLSRITAVFIAEDVLGIVPKGVHEWEKFVSPDDLTHVLHNNGCHVRFVNGLAYNPPCNEWYWIGPTQVNYGLIAQKA